eukprot:756943-Hanusia_phi.AAC.1
MISFCYLHFNLESFQYVFFTCLLTSSLSLSHLREVEDKVFSLLIHTSEEVSSLPQRRSCCLRQRRRERCDPRGNDSRGLRDHEGQGGSLKADERIGEVWRWGEGRVGGGEGERAERGERREERGERREEGSEKRGERREKERNLSRLGRSTSWRRRSGEDLLKLTCLVSCPMR